MWIGARILPFLVKVHTLAAQVQWRWVVDQFTLIQVHHPPCCITQLPSFLRIFKATTNPDIRMHTHTHCTHTFFWSRCIFWAVPFCSVAWFGLGKLAGLITGAMCSPVCQKWAESEALVSRASSGRLVLSPNESLGREDLVTNEEVITPILKHLGLRTTVDQIDEHVALFFEYSRPKGKPAINRSMSKFYGWNRNPFPLLFLPTRWTTHMSPIAYINVFLEVCLEWKGSTNCKYIMPKELRDPIYMLGFGGSKVALFVSNPGSSSAWWASSADAARGATTPVNKPSAVFLWKLASPCHPTPVSWQIFLGRRLFLDCPAVAT